jgi:hypothetical protein
MRPPNLVASLCILLFCGGCGAAHLGAPAVAPGAVITLERTHCGGECPVYKLTISADGAVIFEGKRFVKQVGSARGRISQDKLRELISGFEAANYFSLADSYTPAAGAKFCPQVATDLPSVITSIKINGKTKKVEHYHGCEGLDELPKLTALENKIDEAANTRRWVE